MHAANRIITLCTDFGTRDAYVAALKGVLLGRCPGAVLVDLTHEIPPQDIHEAAIFLAGCYSHFPAGTVHAVVIDPGVGSERLPIAVSAGNQYFVCPDNGVLTLVLRAHPVEAAHLISTPAHRLEPLSATFHGRDLFAPAAAYLAGGGEIAELGPGIEVLKRLEMPEPEPIGEGPWTATIVHVDRFGNCISNLHERILSQNQVSGIIWRGQHLDRLCRTYADVEPGTPMILWGSSGYLEIAVAGGHAAARLGLGRGDQIMVTSHPAAGTRGEVDP